MCLSASTTATHCFTDFQNTSYRNCNAQRILLLAWLNCKWKQATPGYLIDLHWLPVEYRIQFKVLLVTYKALNRLVLVIYLFDLLQRYAPVRNLRSTSAFLLQPTRFCFETYGSRASSVSTPELWNKLPLKIKISSSTERVKILLLKPIFLN